MWISIEDFGKTLIPVLRRYFFENPFDERCRVGSLS